MLKKTMAFVLLTFLIGCSEQGTFTSIWSKDPTSLPLQATIIKDKGNGWIIFELDGEQYLYHKATAPYLGFEAITWMPKKEVRKLFLE